MNVFFYSENNRQIKKAKLKIRFIHPPLSTYTLDPSLFKMSTEDYNGIQMDTTEQAFMQQKPLKLPKELKQKNLSNRRHQIQKVDVATEMGIRKRKSEDSDLSTADCSPRGHFKIGDVFSPRKKKQELKL